MKFLKEDLEILSEHENARIRYTALVLLKQMEEEELDDCSDCEGCYNCTGEVKQE